MVDAAISARMDAILQLGILEGHIPDCMFEFFLTLGLVLLVRPSLPLHLLRRGRGIDARDLALCTVCASIEFLVAFELPTTASIAGSSRGFDLAIKEGGG